MIETSDSSERSVTYEVLCALSLDGLVSLGRAETLLAQLEGQPLEEKR
ncbi:MAG: hypothetical protein AAF439_12135 [Pseudomonadota bacterium]